MLSGSCRCLCSPAVPSRVLSGLLPSVPVPTHSSGAPRPAARFRGRHGCKAPRLSGTAAAPRGSDRSTHPGSLTGPVSPRWSGWQGVTSSPNATGDKIACYFQRLRFP